MSEKDTGGPAFPADRLHNNEWQDGMTLRDYFAAKAMQAVIINSDKHSTEIEEVELWIGQYAYTVADAMLKARKK